MNSMFHEENSLQAQSIKLAENVSSYCFIKRFIASVNLKNNKLLKHFMLLTIPKLFSYNENIWVKKLLLINTMYIFLPNRCLNKEMSKDM